MADVVIQAPTRQVTTYKCVIPSCSVQWTVPGTTLPVHVPNNPHTDADWTAYQNSLPVGQRTNYARYIAVGYTVPPKPTSMAEAEENSLAKRPRV